ncbi:MAG: hypothetical protein LLG00_12870 [Planctomycetaceae bacterium]|nr:hypothetical protein [Planctomycetaceae bacterium]
MNRKVVVLLALASLMALSAQAAVFEDVQIIEQTISAPQFISGTLDLTNPGNDAWPSHILPVEKDIPGFVPGQWCATSGKFEVWVKCMDKSECATVDLGALLTQADQFNGTLFGLLPFENDTELGADFLLEVNATGQLQYKVTANKGCFEIECVALEVCAEQCPVPEPISLVIWPLLGALAVGFNWLRRR